MRWQGCRAACLGLAVFAIAAGAAPGAAAATPNPFYGLNAVRYPTQAELNRAAAAGAGTLRLQVNWGFIEPTPGQRNYTDLDRLVGATAVSGLTLLPVLYGVPEWISRKPSQPPIRTRNEQAAWQSLLADYARRYGTSGTFWAEHPELPKHPITTWQIWNEPNLGGFVGGKPNPRGYARLLRISATALRAADPAARVLSAGLFPYHTLRNTMTMARYLKALYRVPGVSANFDALGIHPYATKPRTVLHWVRVARRIMRRHGDGEKPIWVTEFGWVTGGLRFKYSPLRSTLRQQAGRLTRTYRLFQRNAARLRIASAIWFSYTDHNSPGGPDFWTDRAGLLTLKDKPKPAWYAFVRVAGSTG